ncbi:hypothetical protein ACFQ6S_29605 [Streptomyces sp. NPDC056479]|uniref:hypothetical protein n=1 Tax=Streptomyces sp. NPDC056479 TaxID=3345832 RepID=UPI0036912483
MADAEQGQDGPKLFAPLPDPSRDRRLVFHRHLAELARLAGADLPAEGRLDGREWERHARKRTRQALSGLGELPERLFAPLLRAAVHDPNPSFNRQFVEPAVTAFGRRRVRTALISSLRTGSNEERAGAARAWYWTQVPPQYRAGSSEPTPESRAEWEATAELDAEWQEAALREFVANEELDVRRCLLPGLWLDPRRHRADLHDLVAEAVRIARGHSDEYLRHRVEVQIG